MKRIHTILNIIYFTAFCSVVAFRYASIDNAYPTVYMSYSKGFEQSIEALTNYQNNKDFNNDTFRHLIHNARIQVKKLDFWWRYIDPIQYKLINGPLPVEWETEVFEKYEKPYKRIGGGLTLSEIALDDSNSLEAMQYIKSIEQAYAHLKLDSVRAVLSTPDHFAFCNRLFLLNLASIYTTGFECPNSDRILPELEDMMLAVSTIYDAYENDHSEYQLGQQYRLLYQEAITFVKETKTYEEFDHFKWLSEYINPLYALNAQFILQHRFSSRSMMDYTINKQATSIFQKDLYYGQNTKGIFLRVTDTTQLNIISDLGKMLFYDPILSGNNQRSCASCHLPEQGFTDTSNATALKFNYQGRLKRNAPSLLNAEYNHLVMQDGNHITLQGQALAVITNPEEMGLEKQLILKKVLSIKHYKNTLKALAELTPQSNQPSIDHIVSALTFYYSKFNNNRSQFDLALEKKSSISQQALNGFNLFMSKAQCATCHFTPHFNGVKPPYVGSEFEVLGTPDNLQYTAFGKDSGRYLVNPANETMHAFRTGTLKNISKTAPYMHNGIFKTLEEVIDFYNKGGGAGRGLPVHNQTLSSDELHLSPSEVSDIIVFLKTLDEDYIVEKRPAQLPKSKVAEYNKRQVGGTY